ncbi:MAG: glycosyltransferase family 39 protein [bacterium]
MLLTLLRFVIAKFLPVLGDEAYYCLWAQNLSYGYFDHPLGIAYLYYILTTLLGSTEFAIRFGAILLFTLTSGLIYLIGKDLFEHKVGLLAAIVYNIIPGFFSGSFFLMVEQPFLFLWFLGIYCVVKISKENKPIWFLLLGITLTLGLLTKYTMILFYPCLLLLLILSPKTRSWLKRKEFYLATLLPLLAIVPTVIWNLNYSFASMSYHGGRLNFHSNVFINFAYFLVTQSLIYTPTFVVSCLLLCWGGIKSKDARLALLASFSLPILFCFTGVSLFLQGGSHWTANLFPLAAIYFGWIYFKENKRWLKRSLIATVIFCILLDVVLISYYTLLQPVPKDLIGQKYSINRKLPAFIQSISTPGHKTHVFSNEFRVASVVSFYSQEKVSLVKGRWKQFDLWGETDLKKGDNVVYFARGQKQIFDQLKPLFKRVEKDTNHHFFVNEPDLILNTVTYLCYDYQGGKLP